MKFQIPEGGIRLEGEFPEEIFDLSAEDAAKPVGRARYRLFGERQGNFAIVTGEVEADFELHCVRCNEPFVERVEIGDFHAEEEVAADGMIDLTDRVREDILLALPGYPRCDEARLNPRRCPAEGRFSTVDVSPSESGDETQGGSPWDALDTLDGGKSN